MVHTMHLQLSWSKGSGRGSRQNGEECGKHKEREEEKKLPPLAPSVMLWQHASEMERAVARPANERNATAAAKRKAFAIVDEFWTD